MAHICMVGDHICIMTLLWGQVMITSVTTIIMTLAHLWIQLDIKTTSPLTTEISIQVISDIFNSLLKKIEGHKPEGQRLFVLTFL